MNLDYIVKYGILDLFIYFSIFKIYFKMYSFMHLFIYCKMKMKNKFRLMILKFTNSK